MPEPTWTETQVAAKRAVLDGLWTQCPECAETIFRKSLEANLMVCPKCDHHMRVSARRRIDQLLDPGTFEPLDADMAPMDPLGFVDQKPYIDRLKETQRKSGEIDGVQTGTGFIKGRKLVVGVMDFTFMAGSMGSVVGERLTRCIEHATDHSLPLVIVAGPGGKGTIQLANPSLADQSLQAPAAIRASSHQAGCAPEAAFAAGDLSE